MFNDNNTKTHANSSSPPITASLPTSNWLSGKRWRLKPYDERLSLAIQQQFSLPEILAIILSTRDIDISDVAKYIKPTIRDYMPSPFTLHDMEKAACRIIEAISSQEPIGILGDYDVDGATSSALLMRYFRHFNIQTNLYIPDRISEGYGPNMQAMQHFKEHGIKLVIMVDMGSLAHNVISQANSSGLETIIIDHHQSEMKLPPALALINPNRLDESGELGYLAAVGVSFMLLAAINSKLKNNGHNNVPNLLNLLDLVALGTVGDVVPLIGLNRAIVRQGLRIIQKRSNAGIAALMDVSGIDEPPTTYHLGFMIGPRINAAGRISKADIGAKLLATDCPKQAANLAEQLHKLNMERQAIEAQVTEEAIAQLSAANSAQKNNALLIAHSSGWHEGVIGIAASRLKEHFDKPAVVISWDKDKTGKASARSVSGINIGQVIIAAKQLGLITKGGGHSMAAGFSIEYERLQEFQEFANHKISNKLQHYHKTHANPIDCILPLAAVTPKLAQQLELAGPFGAGNPSPRFLLSNIKIINSKIVGKAHINCILADGDFAGQQNSARIKAIWFKAAETPAGQALLHNSAATWHIIGRIKLDFWQGNKSANIVIEDIAAATQI